MDQRVPYRCQHGHLNGLGPQCYSRCHQVVEPEPNVERAAAPKLEPVEAPPEPKAKPKASSSRWAEYGRRGGRVGGIKISPAKAAAAKVNGARGGRPRKIGKAVVAV